MRLIQQSPDCADFDVIVDEAHGPAFRVLLPEMISADGREDLLDHGFLHTLPGRWTRSKRSCSGEIEVPGKLQLRIQIDLNETDIRQQIGVRNITSQNLKNVVANFCTGVTHLPGAPPWSNRDFIPESVPLDRDLHGQYWYQHVAPRGVRFLTADGWKIIHPQPNDPDPAKRGKYDAREIEELIGMGCAASAVGGAFVFQCWNSPCHTLTPFSGNACMHLFAKVAKLLRPGEEAIVAGGTGVFHGDWQRLAEHMRSMAS